MEKQNQLEEEEDISESQIHSGILQTITGRRTSRDIGETTHNPTRYHRISSSKH